VIRLRSGYNVCVGFVRFCTREDALPIVRWRWRYDFDIYCALQSSSSHLARHSTEQSSLRRAFRSIHLLYSDVEALLVSDCASAIDISTWFLLDAK
jgi:hypothetical protein